MDRMYAILLDSKGALQDFDNLSQDIQESARIAVNYATKRARTQSARYVRQQVNLPAAYVGPSTDRLYVAQQASKTDLTGIVSAKRRSTSLARFSTGAARTGGNQRGVRVQVKPGFSTYLRSAFFIKLRSGKGDVDTRNNLGLAIRTGGGVRPSNAYHPVKMKNGLWLLYGPSVAQTLLGLKETGIWPNMTAEVEDDLTREFFRQMELKGIA